MDKLSLLPLTNAVFSMHSANEDEDEHELESCIRSHTSCGVKLSKIPSDESTKNLSLASRGCQPVTSGSAIRPNLTTKKENTSSIRIASIYKSKHEIDNIADSEL